jgi:hypothetical protein
MKPAFGIRGAGALVLGVVVIAAAGCDGDGVTTAADEGGVYALTLGVTSRSGTLSTIAIDVEPASADGQFVTDGGWPDCEILAPGAFGVLSVLGPEQIRINVASFTGFDTPVDLARCNFAAQTAVGAEDFSAEVVEVSTPDGDSPSPPPVVELTSIAEVVPAATTTTLGEDSTTTTLAAEK